MSSEANIRSKTGKLPVQLYRTFFKVSIAAAIYGVFCVLTGGGEITSASLAAAISVLGAIAYEVVYFLYKSSSDAAKSKGENEKERQLKTLLRFFGYLLGISLLLNSAALIYDGKYYALVTLIIGMALCQQMHNNKYLFSHLSTFFESAVIASAIITLELMFYAGQGEGAVKFMWSFGVVGVVLSEALAQTFFHFYNCQKHGNKAVKEELLRKAGKDGDAPKETDKKQRQRQEMRQLLKKKTLIVDRVTEFLRDLLLLLAIFAVFGILILVGSVTLKTFDIMVAVIPVLFSVASPVIDSQKQGDKKAFDKYDPRITPKDFKNLLSEIFSEDCLSVKALDYVTGEMTAKKGFKRYNGEDYFVHPIAVAMILLENTSEGDEVIASALLHDCIEDIDGCDKAFIEAEYSKTVADYVDLLSKKDGVNYRRHENMEAYLDNIAAVPKAALIKIADRINNVNTLENCSDAEKMRKYRQTRMYYPRFLASVSEKDSENGFFFDFAEKCFEENKY